MAEGEQVRDGACAMAWSGGKDSTLACHRARTGGRRVTHLFSVYDGASGRLGFHGVPKELLAAQARALGLEPVLEPAGEDGFEEAFGRALDRLSDAGVSGVIFGNIHLEDVRDWYEERTRARGFEHIEPLWGGPPARLAREFVTLGYRARVVSVLLEEGDPAWLGRELDLEFVEAVEALEGVDPGGERGEFHSFAWDGPLFRHPVPVVAGEEREREGHRYLDLQPGE